MTSTTNIETEAFVVDSPNAPFKLTPIVLDEMREDEFLIEMKYSGICHTELVWQANQLPGLSDPPAIFGHEGAGIVRAMGANVHDKSIQVGDPVLLSHSFCRTCKRCTSGHPSYCDNGMLNLMGTRSDGSTTSKRKSDGQVLKSQFFGQSSFSRLSIVREACVVKFPGNAEDMGIFAACGCGFQTGAGTVLNILKPKPDESVVIFGMGSVGLTALMGAKHLKVKQIVAVDLTDSRLQMAKELGATHVVNSKDVADMPKHITELTSGGAAFCIDCTGVPKVIETMIDCIAPLGTAASVGMAPAGSKVTLDPATFMLSNKRLIGCTEGDSVPYEFIPKLISMQQRGEFPIEKLCTFYPYTEMDKALADMHNGSAIKPVIQW